MQHHRVNLCDEKQIFSLFSQATLLQSVSWSSLSTAHSSIHCICILHGPPHDNPPREFSKDKGPNYSHGPSRPMVSLAEIDIGLSPSAPNAHLRKYIVVEQSSPVPVEQVPVDERDQTPTPGDERDQTPTPVDQQDQTPTPGEEDDQTPTPGDERDQTPTPEEEQELQLTDGEHWAAQSLGSRSSAASEFESKAGSSSARKEARNKRAAANRVKQEAREADQVGLCGEPFFAILRLRLRERGLHAMHDERGRMRDGVGCVWSRLLVLVGCREERVAQEGVGPTSRQL